MVEMKLYVLDSGGKYNIHKYMNLFERLGISHSVIADDDCDTEKEVYINDFILSKKNKFTYKIDFFEKNIEKFLEIELLNTKDYKKPLNMMWHYKTGKIKQEKIDLLKGKISNILLKKII